MACDVLTVVNTTLERAVNVTAHHPEGPVISRALQSATALALATLATLAASPAHADISGTVVDAATGDPVVGARVTVRGGATTTTGAGGAFTVAAADGVEVTVVAAHVGHYNAWDQTSGPRTDLALALDRLPADDPAAAFDPPETCATCHAEQYADWTGTPMAKAGRNTWVADLYDGSGTAGGLGGFVYTRDSVLAEHNPGSECASCHQPLRWVATPYTALAPHDDPSDDVAHGVSCDLCHRIASIDATRPSFPGIWPGVVELVRSEAPVELGVLGDVAYEAGAMRPSYQPQLTADVCAACHQDKNDPDEDGDFEEDDGVISEPTYLEWRDSPYADPEAPEFATCVDCHMPPRDDLTSACTVQDLAPRPPGQLRSHRIEGTTAAYLEASIALDLEAEVVDGELVVDAAITNDRVGHHVPTGVTVRNMILRIEATGPDGAPLEPLGDQVIDELGGVGDPEEGYWAGLPGKLYAKVPADADGNAPTFFTDAASLASDNRIPALATDRTSYRFALPDGPATVTVRARVVYRRAFRALVDAKGWTTDGHGQPLEDLIAPDYGHRMAAAEVEVEVEVDAPPDDVEPDGGCGCRGAGADTGAGALATIVAVVAFAIPARRRRRPDART